MTKVKDSKKVATLSKSEMARAEKFRDMLTSQLGITNGLIDGLKEQAKGLEEASKDMDSFDSSSNNSELNGLKNLQVQHIKKVQTLKSALLRLDQNKFGICLDCEDDIPEKRLMSNPNTLRCVGCQEELEHKQKQHRSPGNRPQSASINSDDDQN